MASGATASSESRPPAAKKLKFDKYQCGILPGVCLVTSFRAIQAMDPTLSEGAAYGLENAKECLVFAEKFFHENLHRACCLAISTGYRSDAKLSRKLRREGEQVR